MKRVFTISFVVCIFLLAFSFRVNAQYDSIAVAILDSASNVISDLESCSFRFTTEYDISNDEYGLITHFESGMVDLKGPFKMMVEKKGDKGHKKFFYDGKNFLLYSFDKNQYASIPSSISVIELIDSVSSHYGVEFPGADVFYPDFVDNILENSNNLVYLGLALVGDTECYHIAGAEDSLTFQFWITSSEPSLIKRMSIVYINKPGDPRYQITFSDWKLNEYIDDSVFQFSLPDGAQQIKLIK